MTRKQAAALAFLAQYHEQHGNSPSFDEIRVQLNLKSKSNVHRILDALQREGFIRRSKHFTRSIQIIDPGEVKLNAEMFRLVQDYSKKIGHSPDTIVNAALRDWFGAAA